MAPGSYKPTLTVNGFAQKVQMVGSQCGPNTGGITYTLETEDGRRSRWSYDPGAQSNHLDPLTGDQWGTLG